MSDASKYNNKYPRKEHNCSCDRNVYYTYDEIIGYKTVHLDSKSQHICNTLFVE